MRKTAIMLTTVLLLLAYTFSCGAESERSVELALSAEEAVVGRLFKVNVSSNETSSIVGGEITLCYDDSVLGFKKASSDSFEVKTKTYDDATKIVFVIDDESVEDNRLFDLEFKGKCNATTQLELVSSYVVDRGLDTVSAFGSCDVVINKKKTQEGKTTKDKDKVLSATYDMATSDEKILKVDGYRNYGLLKYITAGVVIVATAGINLWFMLRKKR